MKILVSGFEPFGGSRLNPSELVAKGLTELQPVDGTVIVSEILPVDGREAPDLLWAAVRRHNPDAVLCLGEASQRPALSIERIAINLMDYRIPDRAGNQFRDQAVVEGGPAAYFVTLPVHAMLGAAQTAGVPAELSLSAGSYLCNQVLYSLLHRLAELPSGPRCGFIHLPALPEQVAERNISQPSMALATGLRGVTAVIHEVCQTSI